MRKNNRRQFHQYVTLFGKGLVLYWFGYIDDMKSEDSIMLGDTEILKELEKSLEMKEKSRN
jgi:hypothetical protein